MTNLVERARTAAIELRATLRVLRNAPRFLLPSAKTSPATLVRRWAEDTPSAAALRFEDERYDWRQLNDQANRFAAFFHDRGIRAGDVVAVVMDNRPEFLFALVALNKLGAVGALINTHLAGHPLVHAISVAKPTKVLVGSEHVASVADIAAELAPLTASDLWVHRDRGVTEVPAIGEVVDEEIAAKDLKEMSYAHTPRNSETFCFIYTSGTTGLPKAAIITNQRMLAAATVFGESMVENGPGEMIYVPLPLYHSSAMFIGFGSALAMGGAMALRRKFSASQFWKDVRTFDATAMLYIGELCRYLLNSPPQPGERDHRLRVAVGNGLRPDIWVAFQERFGVPLVREFYGATEGNAPILNVEGRPGMVGRIRPGQVVVRCDPATGALARNAEGFCERVETGQVGLLLGRISPIMRFDGYVDAKATSAKVVQDIFRKGDRYFNTGDLVALHENRWLSFADRLGDTFRWKGENVSTNEVAETLNGCPGVLEANVYGVQVPHTEGRAGMAAVSAEPGFDVQRLAGHALKHLARYQLPYFLRILDSGMQTTATLKHQKVDYRNDGYDPAKVRDPLYFLDGDRYVPIDPDVYARLESGDLVPR